MIMGPLRMALPVSFAFFLASILSGVTVCSAQEPPPQSAPRTYFDTRLTPLRSAALAWELRLGPKRQVIDQVCLVPDVPTFFEAIATWDQTKFFPILIDDVALTSKFLKAFKPTRVIRFPRKGSPIEPEQLWEAATKAVGRSWAIEDELAVPGDQVPSKLGTTPPALIITSPDSPSLPGAVALAAGRFQPIIRWEPKFKDGEIPEDDAMNLRKDLEALVEKHTPSFRGLGDSCDFLTLAGNYPYRYATPKGGNAFDDLIGRDTSTNLRWAFTGRLLGDAKYSVYRAMCSLFLQPENALLFNTYDRSPPWGEYTMDQASLKLANRFQVTHKSLPDARYIDWVSTITLPTSYGFVMLNSSGGPGNWSIQGGGGCWADVPISTASVVLTIHSFSAADPTNLDTIAGRWLAGGAFIYYGSLNEPYLNAFRVPTLVSALIDEGLPLGAIVRQGEGEYFGMPWRLVYLGDPLYRFLPKNQVNAARLPAGGQFLTYPSYTEDPLATVPKDSAAQLAWALKASIVRWPTPSYRSEDILQVLMGIPRNKLESKLRPIYDALLIDAMQPGPRRAELRTKLLMIPPEERGPDFKMAFEWSIVQDMNSAAIARDVSRARRYFEEALKAPIPSDLKLILGDRALAVMESLVTLKDWRARLQVLLKETDKKAESDAIKEHQIRVEAKIRARSS